MNKPVTPDNRKIVKSTHSKLGEKNKMGQTFTEPNDFFYESVRTPSFMTGSEVIRAAIKVASCDMSIAYPITPQSEAAALARPAE